MTAEATPGPLLRRIVDALGGVETEPGHFAAACPFCNTSGALGLQASGYKCTHCGATSTLPVLAGMIRVSAEPDPEPSPWNVEAFAERLGLPPVDVARRGVYALWSAGAPTVAVRYFGLAGEELGARFFFADAPPTWKRRTKPSLYGLQHFPAMLRAGHGVIVGSECAALVLAHLDIDALALPAKERWREGWGDLPGAHLLYAEPDERLLGELREIESLRPRVGVLSLEGGILTNWHDSGHDPEQFRARWAAAVQGAVAL